MSWLVSQIASHRIFVLSVLLAKNRCLLAEIKCYPAIKIVLLQILPCFRHVWWIHMSLMSPQFSVALWLQNVGGCVLACQPMLETKGSNQTSEWRIIYWTGRSPVVSACVVQNYYATLIASDWGWFLYTTGRSTIFPSIAHTCTWCCWSLKISDFCASASANFALDTHL